MVGKCWGMLKKKKFNKFQLLATVVSWAIKKTIWNKNGSEVRKQLTEENQVVKEIYGKGSWRLWLLLTSARGRSGSETQDSETQTDAGSRPLSHDFIIIMSPYALPLPFAHCPSAVPCTVLSLEYKLIRIHVLHSCVNCRAYSCSFRQK